MLLIYNNRMYANNHPEVPYRYYYDVFHNEFTGTLGFGLPKTDCCNECEAYKTKRTAAIQDNNQELVQQLEAEHTLHLQTADKRRNEMNIDFGDIEFIDPQTHNVTLAHDLQGNIIDDLEDVTGNFVLLFIILYLFFK